MKLNLGSGDMIKSGYVNFDGHFWKLRDGRTTDILGTIEAMPFKDESFDEIFCAHVIEHFIFSDAQEVLKKCFNLLKSGGRCIMEGPCVLGSYELYVVRHNNVKKYIESLYGAIWHRSPHGEYGIHKFGWTKEIMAEEMSKIGFNITHTGIGLSHGMGKRDFRVEGGKP